MTSAHGVVPSPLFPWIQISVFLLVVFQVTCKRSLSTNTVRVRVQVVLSSTRNKKYSVRELQHDDNDETKSTIVLLLVLFLYNDVFVGRYSRRISLSTSFEDRQYWYWLSECCSTTRVGEADLYIISFGRSSTVDGRLDCVLVPFFSRECGNHR